MESHVSVCINVFVCAVDGVCVRRWVCVRHMCACIVCVCVRTHETGSHASLAVKITLSFAMELSTVVFKSG